MADAGTWTHTHIHTPTHTHTHTHLTEHLNYTFTEDSILQLTQQCKSLEAVNNENMPEPTLSSGYPFPKVTDNWTWNSQNFGKDKSRNLPSCLWKVSSLLWEETALTNWSLMISKLLQGKFNIHLETHNVIGQLCFYWVIERGLEPKKARKSSRRKLVPSAFSTGLLLCGIIPRSSTQF